MSSDHAMSPDQKLPLSQAQLGIWLGQQLNHDSAIYNTAEYVRIRADIDMYILQRAIAHVLSQANLLTLRFTREDETPYQYYVPSTSKITDEVPIFDYSAFSEEVAMQMFEAWKQATIAKPIHLSQVPPCVQAIFKLGESHYIWYQQIHHIAIDGYGFHLLYEHVPAVYHKLDQGISEVDLALDLGDFQAYLAEDAQYQASRFRKTSQQFWQRYFQHYAPPPPPTTSQAKVLTQAIQRTSCEISQTQLATIKAFAIDQAINWTDVLIAGVAMCLHHTTEQTDFMLGLPVMNRMGSKSIKIPTMVMNISPLRIVIKSQDTLLTLSTRIHQALKTIKPHQRYRYEDIKADTKTTYGHAHIFGPVINILPFDSPIQFKGMPFTPTNVSAGPVEDISFGFIYQSNKDNVRFTIDANPTLYSADTLQTYASRFQSMLTQALSQPLEHIITDNDICHRRNALSIIEGEQTAYDINSHESTHVLTLIAKQASLQPEKIAIEEGSQSINYAQLWLFITTLSQDYLDQTHADRIVILAERGIWTYTLMLSCLYSKITFTCLDPKGPEVRNSAIIADVQPDLIYHDASLSIEQRQSLHQAYPQANIVTQKILVAVTQSSAIAELQALLNGCNVDLTTYRSCHAYIMYTSGSTGTPKGVCVTHDNLTVFIQHANRVYGINTHDRVLQFAPLHFDACIEEIFIALSAGATLITRNEQCLQSTHHFLTFCQHKRISVLDLPTAFWHELVYSLDDHSQRLCSHIRTTIIGGEAVNPERVAQWHRYVSPDVALFNTYGPTEATVVATTKQLTPNSENTIGKPLSHFTACVVDAFRLPVPLGVTGELMLIGPSVANGYWHNTQKSAESFLDADFHTPEKHYQGKAYLTGDKVRLTAQGEIEYIGRTDFEIKISGQRISPHEIEHTAMQHPHIQSCAAIAHKVQHTYIIALFYQLSSAAEVNEAALKAFLQEKLPTVMVPAHFISQQSMPLSAAGKIDRATLKAQLIEQLNTASKNASQEEIEYDAYTQSVISIWQEILHIQGMTPIDDFFMVGGQSLQTIQVASRLSKQWGISLAVADIFSYPSAQLLAAFIQANVENETVTEVDISDTLKQDANYVLRGQALSHATLPLLADTPQHILLTGANGFVGCQLLYTYLTSTTHTIYCLIRANDKTHARSKLRQAFEEQSLQGWNSDRIHIVLGDLASPRLGLTEKTFKALAASTDSVVHNGARVSVALDYQSLKHANVESTRTLLDFCSHTKLKPLTFVSTISVCHTQHDDTFIEQYEALHSGLQDGYQRSKWVAEKLVEQAGTLGIPTQTVRLGRVIGDLTSHYVNPKDLVWQIIASSIRLKCYPELDFQEPWTPVDQAASAIVQLHQQLSTCEKPDTSTVFHALPYEPVALKAVFAWLQENGFRYISIDMANWCKLLEKSTDDNDKALSTFFSQQQTSSHKPKHTHTLRFANTRFSEATQHRLSGFNMSQSDFSAYVRYAIDKHFIQRPMTTQAPKITQTNTAPARRTPCMLTLLKKEYIHPALMRLTFTSEGLHDFPTDSAGLHIKLFFPREHQTIPVLPILGPKGPVWPPAPDKPIARTYSVRKFDPLMSTIAIEFVDHGHHSPASGWARMAQVGDQIGLAGPGGPDPLIAPSDFYIFAADLSAMPAAAALLESLDDFAKGIAVLHVPEGSGTVPITCPEGLIIKWVHTSEQLIHTFKDTDLSPHKGRCSAFIAGERHAVISIRNHLKATLGLTKQNMYAIPYWRQHSDEEDFHQDRHVIMDEVY